MKTLPIDNSHLKQSKFLERVKEPGIFTIEELREMIGKETLIFNGYLSNGRFVYDISEGKFRFIKSRELSKYEQNGIEEFINFNQHLTFVSVEKIELNLRTGDGFMTNFKVINKTLSDKFRDEFVRNFIDPSLSTWKGKFWWQAPVQELNDFQLSESLVLSFRHLLGEMSLRSRIQSSGDCERAFILSSSIDEGMAKNVLKLINYLNFNLKSLKEVLVLSRRIEDRYKIKIPLKKEFKDYSTGCNQESPEIVKVIGVIERQRNAKRNKPITFYSLLEYLEKEFTAKKVERNTVKFTSELFLKEFEVSSWGEFNGKLKTSTFNEIITSKGIPEKIQDIAKIVNNDWYID